MKRATGLLLLPGVALLVFFITRELYRPAPPTEEVTSTVLLERIRPVLKLVTVEGDLSEVFTYSDHSAAWFDWPGTWAGGQEFGIEVNTIKADEQARLEQFVTALV